MKTEDWKTKKVAKIIPDVNTQPHQINYYLANNKGAPYTYSELAVHEMHLHGFE